MKELKLIACFGLLFIINPNFSFAQQDLKLKQKNDSISSSNTSEIKINSTNVFRVENDKPAAPRPIIRPTRVEGENEEDHNKPAPKK